MLPCLVSLQNFKDWLENLSQDLHAVLFLTYNLLWNKWRHFFFWNRAFFLLKQFVNHDTANIKGWLCENEVAIVHRPIRSYLTPTPHTPIMLFFSDFLRGPRSLGSEFGIISQCWTGNILERWLNWYSISWWAKGSLHEMMRKWN